MEFGSEFILRHAERNAAQLRVVEAREQCRALLIGDGRKSLLEASGGFLKSPHVFRLQLHRKALQLALSMTFY
jgi:hypothetical protein